MSSLMGLRKRRKRFLCISRLSMFLAVVVAASACASLPPAKSVKNVGEIAGAWEGTVSGQGAILPIKNMVIKPDGGWDFELVGGNPPRHTGTVQLVDGKLRARSTTTGNTATWTLHEGEGKRVLKVVNDDGRVTADLTPVKR